MIYGALSRMRSWWTLRIILPNAVKWRDEATINSLLLHGTPSEVRLYLRQLGCTLADTSYIESGLILHNGFSSHQLQHHNLQVGEHCYVGKQCLIDLSERVALSDRVTIAMRVTIITHFDGGDSDAAKMYGTSCAGAYIKAGAYIGAGATILPGVTIGEGTIVAAGAVVTTSTGDHAIVGGVPAKPLRDKHSAERV